LNKPNSIEEEKAKDIEVFNIKKFDKRINHFWNDTKDHYDLVAERNLEYLNWRYCDPRGGEYKVKIAEESNRVLGYIVSREKNSGEGFNQDSMGYIVDLFIAQDRFDVARILLDDVLKEFNHNSVNLIQSFVLKKHPYEGIFRKKGFLDSRAKPMTLYKKLGSKIKIKDLNSPKRLHLQYGDTDWI
jgi:hypothetical protein